MAEVADYLLGQGYKWWSESSDGNFLKCTLGSDRDFFYAASEEDYESCSMREIPPEIELAIFGRTEGITGRKENTWRENTGTCPVGSDELIDVKYAAQPIYYNVDASVFWWDKRGWSSDITHWRYAEKPDSEYFVKPETVGKEVPHVSEPVRNKASEMHEAIHNNVPAGPIKSDGGSSSYYKLTIKTKDGSFECETGDVIAAMVGDNFALGNALKALRRIWCASEGVGKEGIDMKYDSNKISFFVKDFIERQERK